MSKQVYTDTQLKKALNLSIECSKKKWQHSTSLKMADKIADSIDKDEMMAQIEALLKTEITEKEFLIKLKSL